MAWMLAMIDTLTPLVWAGASAAVLGITWLLRKAGGATIDDRIDAKLDKLYARLDAHLVAEEQSSQEINSKLASLETTLLRTRERDSESRRRLWEAIEQLRRR